MEEQEEKKVEEKKEKTKDELSFCTNAPCAEHARANLADDPCDDYREGK